MNLIGERFFWYRYRIVIVCSVTGALGFRANRETRALNLCEKINEGRYFSIQIEQTMSQITYYLTFHRS